VGKDIIWFKDLAKSDVGLAGGKGANLGELIKANMPVPPGFVVSAQAYDEFLEEKDLKQDINDILKEIDVKNTDQLNQAADNIKKLVISAGMSDKLKQVIVEAYNELSKDAIRIAGQGGADDGEYVAVRSSATAEDLPGASFAGQQKNLLEYSWYRCSCGSSKKVLVIFV